ncbi:MAG: zf-HC2 domain-containing protein [Candidatus Auribacter fodinae]|jgi:hypothetical protein|uniref:Zf-HC2 domain-containing protein n=1 Tax=Candidatus Auribacter fodinae TaxID=2093366 RepID=A0A3A4REQ7_9BACT|nr:MAG: zf-HC2 domain-containing protein [Candidatus Auribacter fodinae]
MDCSKYTYYISEYIDDRLDIGMSRKVENHLKECEQCKKLKDNLLELKDLMHIKSYEKPKGDYFEHLESKIKQRIIAQDIVSIRESVFTFFTQPSWSMTAALLILLSVSLTLNFFNYRDNIIAARADNEPVQSASVQQSLNGTSSTTVDTAASKYYTPEYSNNTDSNISGMIHTASLNDDHRNVYMLKPIRVQNFGSQKRARIYQ